MYGAILGDIIGSPYEYAEDFKWKYFKLFEKGHFTDDSVLTVAVADALLSCDSIQDIEDQVIFSLRFWGNKYDELDYGYYFYKWLKKEVNCPYNSFGNGCAMRTSPIGWLYDTLEQTRNIAGRVASVTHNHPEGIKGAEAVVSAIYLARIGESKKKIKHYIEKEFDYDLNRTCKDIQKDYYHIESCQRTVPEAIIAFLEGIDFEDSIRNAVALGGDADTLGCITGSIAEAFWGINDEFKMECRNRLKEDMLDVIDRFYNYIN